MKTEIKSSKKPKIQSEKKKGADNVTSIRLSSFAIKQLDDLQILIGENASRVIIRAISIMHDKYQYEMNDQKEKPKTPKKDIAKVLLT